MKNVDALSGSVTGYLPEMNEWANYRSPIHSLLHIQKRQAPLPFQTKPITQLCNLLLSVSQ